MAGFSERNLGYMVRFAKKYQVLDMGDSILQQAVAKLAQPDLLLNIPWGHHALLIEKVKDQPTRFWYMEQTLEQGWSDNLKSSLPSIEDIENELAKETKSKDV